jgi:hypothetical protein
MTPQVIVWEAATGQRKAILEGHQNLVKGVAWDPVGKYLASQGDDRSLIIWRVEDWTRAARVTDAWKVSKAFVSMTFSLRCALHRSRCAPRAFSMDACTIVPAHSQSAQPAGVAQTACAVWTKLGRSFAAVASVLVGKNQDPIDIELRLTPYASG